MGQGPVFSFYAASNGGSIIVGIEETRKQNPSAQKSGNKTHLRAINLQARRAEAVDKGGFCWIHLEIFPVLQ